MPAKRTSGVTVTVTVESLPRPKHQQKIGTARKSIRQRTGGPVATLRKEQSTLTQLDFVSTPINTSEVDPISSDEEFEEPRPKKRRRKSKFDTREADQSSLTQMVDFSRMPTLKLDEDGFQIWDDGIDVVEPVARTTRRNDGGNRRRSRRQQPEEDEEGKLPDIPETSQNVIPSSPRAASAVNMAGMAPKVQTPLTKRIKEIPSSQTPPSTRYSTRKSDHKPGLQRSPLKERSTNVLSTTPKRQSSGSQKMGSGLFKRARSATKTVPLNDSFEPTDALEQNVGVPAEPSKPSQPSERRPRKLLRVNTVQDSQTEDLDLSNTTFVAESPVNATPKLVRVSTVQETQFDDAGLLSDPVEATIISSGQPETYQDQHQPTYGEKTQAAGYTQAGSYTQTGGYTQATFDPVDSALDRDASRFEWTQNQAVLPLVVDEQHEDSETDDDDLDRGCYQRTAFKVPGVLDRLHQTRDELVTESSPSRKATRPGATTERVHGDEEARADVSGNDGDEDGDATIVAIQADTEAAVPSSPSPALPSQDSTVVPTQFSLKQNYAPEDDLAEQQPDTMLSEAPTIIPLDSSPKLPGGRFETLYSSSPLPLPPWSSPGHVRELGAAARHALQVKDWSLPPPPPMSSSRVGTPASSSR